jgi:Family of unknown function (DUF5995)
MTTKLGRLAKATSVDDVLTNVAQIIDWASTEESPIGYFAVVYQRVTLAVQKAIRTPKKFEDPALVAKLDVAFAQRYFSALNGFFYPNAVGGLTLPWEVAFVGALDKQAIILQHLLIAFNAHISFDLGMACCTVAPAPAALTALKGDFDRVNKILADQIPGIVDVLQKLSPELVWTRRLIPDELRVFNGMLENMRRGAWLFAVYMVMHKDGADQKRVRQEAEAAVLNTWYLQAPGRCSPLPALIHGIAEHESHDVAENMKALQK